MRTLWQDVRYGVRMLSKSPGFTAIALITLALGIGANTVMFSLVNALLFRPAHVQAPHELAVCRSANSRVSPYPIYAELRDDNPVFRDLLACSAELLTLEQGEVAKQVLASFVSANYFSTLGVQPARGRAFFLEEEQPGTPPVVILSHRAWQRQGADPGIIGTRVRINGTPVEVVGVAPEGFTGPIVVGPDIWLPLGVYGSLCCREGDKAYRSRQTCSGLTLIGRLKPEVSLSVAQARMQPLAAHLQESYPREWKDAVCRLDRLPRLAVDGPNDRGTLSRISLFLMGISTVVLLIACLNLANMYVVQGSSRQREIAIRMAIGGGRRRIIRQLLLESLLLAVLGGALGLVLAWWGTKVLNVLLASIQLPIALQMTLEAGLDVRVLAATVGFCVLATLLSGLRPAWRLSRRALPQDLKESRGVSRPADPRHRFLPRGLSTAGQIALSVVLVMGASLFTHSALKAVRATPGYSLDDKLLLQVDMRAGGIEGAQRRRVCESLMEHLGALPGVQATGVSYSMPFDTGMMGCEIREYKGTPVAGVQERGVEAVLYYVGGDFFQTLGLPLLRGRYFSPAESAAGDPNVVIIDEPLARQLRPDGNALGCLIGGLGRAKEVIGIVPGTRHSIFDKEAPPHVYALIWDTLRKSGRPLYVHLRVASAARGAQTALLRQIPQEVHQVDAQLAVLSLTTLRDYHRNGPHVWFARMVAALTLTFGGMALFLASLGIYAVKGYLVASRTPEIGIRMALGATSRGILAMILRDGAVLTLVGLSLGLLLAFGVARVASSVLCGVSPIDPLSIAVTLALLGTASLLAGYLPARRAARIDPMVALRYE